MKFLELAANHSRATLSVLVFILLAGVGARSLINVDLNPDVTVPVVLVMVPHQGISAEDSARLLIKPLEAELKSLDGIDELNATAREGFAYVVVEFDMEVDINAAQADVREAVERAKAEFPEGTDEPLVKEVSATSEPTVVVTFSGEGLLERELYQVARTLRQKIETLPDVLEANLRGNREEVVEVILDPASLEHYNLTADEMLRAVLSNNLLIPAGDYDTGQGRFSVKVPGLIEDRLDILTLPVKATADAVVTLGDIASIRRTFKDPTSFSHINGRKAIAIEVYKRNQANAIVAVDAIRKVIADEQPRIPQGLQIDYIFDVSEFALQMVGELQGNILTAIALVMVVVVAALGLQSGLLVGFGIPFSLLGATVIVYLMGFSFNFMVMFGLLLALGMLIDGAIVVVEYADRQFDKGLSVKEAYLSAVHRMSVPVIASTATTLAVFLPLMFWPGVAGEFMSYLPVTVFAVLSWSLLYALFFGPILGIIIGRHREKRRIKHPAIYGEQQHSGAFKHLGRGYARLMNRALDRPLLVLATVIVGLLGIYILYGMFGRGVEFFVQTEERYGLVSVRAQGNLTVADKARLSAEVEERVLQIPEVRALYAASRGPSLGAEREIPKDEISSLLIELVEVSERDKLTQPIFEDIRNATRDIPGIIVSANPLEGGPPVGKGIQIQLTSDDREKMYAEAVRIRRYLESHVEGLRDIEDTLPLPGIEWELKVDRAEAAMLGVDTLQVGNMVQLVTNGIEIGEFRPDDADDEVEIRVRFPSEHRGIHALDQLRVTTPNGPIPISTFVTRKAKPRVNSIQRVDQAEVILIKSNTVDGVLPDDKVKEIADWLKTADIDPSVTATFRGANEEQAESAEFLSVAFSMALFLMLILMVMQFNSFYQAFLILSAVIMSTAGVLLSLLIYNEPFSVVMSGIGIVALAGIVVNNNIVLIDTYNRLLRERTGMSCRDAAHMAAMLRLRPILLTTITTAVGLLPLASNVSLDFTHRLIEVGGVVTSWWHQLASAIVYGLMFSTLLTLLLTPVMLALPSVLRARLSPHMAKWTGHGMASGE